MHPTLIQAIGAALFCIALVHTFSTKFFEHLAHTRPAHAGLWHFLAEVEVVFGFWAMVLMVCMFAIDGKEEAIRYLDGRNFTEPLFVFAIIVTAASKPILQLASLLTRFLTRLVPLPGAMGQALVILAFVPLLGSFITEPAAMTLAALLLRDGLFKLGISEKLKYGVLGVLFVNVSIGGTLTPYAAPPVLMVAGAWGWDLGFMLSNFGWKAALAVGLNSLGLVVLFAREFIRLRPAASSPEPMPPLAVTLIHLGFLVGIVAFAHHAVVFLAGLVVLGGQQRWWLEPALLSMSSDAVYYGATALTAITDNAALTYLGSLVPGLSPDFKYALVAGAVTGGGLTLIANAPNPAGAAILKGELRTQSVSALALFLSAAGPTVVAMACLKLL